MRIIILFFFTSFQILCAQQESKLITSGKWYIDYTEVAGQKMESPAEAKDSNWVSYHEGGEYEGMEEGQEYFGKWAFDSEKKVIRIDDLSGEVEQKIVSINESAFVIFINDDGMEIIIGMKKY